VVTLQIRKAAPVLAVLFCAIFLRQLPVTVLSTQACETVQPVPGTKLDVELDVGSMHFRGEIADFYVLFSLVGNPVDPEVITAKLYFNGTLCSQLTSSVKHVATGLYRIPYTIPLNASVGNTLWLLMRLTVQLTTRVSTGLL